MPSIDSEILDRAPEHSIGTPLSDFSIIPTPEELRIIDQDISQRMTTDISSLLEILQQRGEEEDVFETEERESRPWSSSSSSTTKGKNRMKNILPKWFSRGTSQQQQQQQERRRQGNDATTTDATDDDDDTGNETDHHHHRYDTSSTSISCPEFLQQFPMETTSIEAGRCLVNKVGSIHRSYTLDEPCLLFCLGPNVHAHFLSS